MAPANNQPLLSDGKKLVIAALAVFGLFLLCYGTGESAVVIAGSVLAKGSRPPPGAGAPGSAGRPRGHE